MLLTDEQLKEIAARVEAARSVLLPVDKVDKIVTALLFAGISTEDALLCRAAQPDIPALLAHIEHQRREIESLKKTAEVWDGYVDGSENDNEHLLVHP